MILTNFGVNLLLGNTSVSTLHTSSPVTLVSAVASGSLATTQMSGSNIPVINREHPDTEEVATCVSILQQDTDDRAILEVSLPSRHVPKLEKPMQRTAILIKGGAEKERIKRRKIMLAEAECCKKLSDIFARPNDSAGSASEGTVDRLFSENNHIRADDDAVGQSSEHSGILNCDSSSKSNCGTPSQDECSPWPNVWTRDQYLEFSSRNSWLDCRDGKLGCKICAEVAQTPIQAIRN